MGTARATLHRWYGQRANTTGRPPPPRAGSLIRRWAGPWNLHNLHQTLDGTGRAQLAALLTHGKPDYARLVALTLAIDDHADLAAVIRNAELSSRLPIPASTATTYTTLLHRAGWVTTA